MKAAHETGKKEDWQIAKMAAETARLNLSALEIIQNIERRAWGLDQHTEAEIVIANPRGRMGDEG